MMMMIMRNLQSKELFPDIVVWFLLASILIRFLDKDILIML